MLKPEAPIRVLFVCMGNICRSPLAEGVFRELVQKAGYASLFEIDSAGTHFYHVGDPPDTRSIAVAAKYGVDISTQRCRQLSSEDFSTYHYLLVMDERNMRDVNNLKPCGLLPKTSANIVKILDYAPEQAVRDVPDPYYGEHDGFEYVYQLVSTACQGLLQSVLNARLREQV